MMLQFGAAGNIHASVLCNIVLADFFLALVSLLPMQQWKEVRVGSHRRSVRNCVVRLRDRLKAVDVNQLNYEVHEFCWAESKKTRTKNGIFISKAFGNYKLFAFLRQ